MLSSFRYHSLILWALCTFGVVAQAQVPPLVGAPNAVWRPVWFIEGPLVSQVPPEWSNNELRVESDQLVLALADGQQWSRPLPALQSIRYFRQFERLPAIIVTRDGWLPNPAALYRSRNHFVDLVLSDETEQEQVLTLQLDKSVYQLVLATLQRRTAKPVLASVEDSRTLPATLRIEQSSFTRTPSPRATLVAPSVPYRLTADANGRMVAAVLMDGSVQVWDTETGGADKRWQAIEGTRFPWNLPGWIAFRPESNFVAVSSSKAGIQQWDATSGVRRNIVIRPGAPREPLSFWFSPDGSKLIIADAQQGFSCWDPDTGMPLNCLETYHGSLQALARFETARGVAAAFNAAGTQLALSTQLIGERQRRVVTVLEWPAGSLLQQFVEGGERVGQQVGFVAKGRLAELYLGNFDLWELSGPRLRGLRHPWPPSSHNTSALSETLIASGGRDRELLLYSAETGRAEARLAIGTWVSAISFISGDRLAAATVGGAVQIWETSTRRLVRELSPTP